MRDLSLEHRTGYVADFWKALAAYEDATIQEAVALSESDFARLDLLSDFKRSALAKLQALGARCGLDRRNKDLRERLEALEMAEKMNMESAAQIMAQIRRENDEVLAACRRLNSLRGAYAGDTPGPAFFAEG